MTVFCWLKIFRPSIIGYLDCMVLYVGVFPLREICFHFLLLITSWAVTDSTSPAVVKSPIFLSHNQLYIQLFISSLQQLSELHFPCFYLILSDSFEPCLSYLRRKLFQHPCTIHAGKPPGISRTACFSSSLCNCPNSPHTSTNLCFAYSCHASLQPVFPCIPG